MSNDEELFHRHFSRRGLLAVTAAAGTGVAASTLLPGPADAAPRDAISGFAAFAVDPGTRVGGVTTITVTYYDVVGTGGQLQPFESFTLRRRRSDAH